MKLIYLPLELYKERYTYFMSSVNGWTEDTFKKNNIKFLRIDGESLGDTISTGSVLDAYARPYYALSQIKKVIKLLKNNEIKPGDVIYADDFYHPGIDSLFYIRDLSKIDFKIGCFLYAQSIDDSDFTHFMKKWLRDIEIGLSKGYDYIFVCSPILRQLAIDAGYDENKIIVSGLSFNSNRLLEQINEIGFKEKEKEKYVIFSSRFDDEKNPNFFMDLVERCPDINFKLVKPRKHLSNNSLVCDRAEYLQKNSYNFEIVDTSDKNSYYSLLSGADVQFNCAIQDWVSFTLLEAIKFRCKPLYPRWKDFPQELKGFEDICIYENKDLNSAENKLRNLMSIKFDDNLSKIVDKHDQTLEIHLNKMGFI